MQNLVLKPRNNSVTIVELLTEPGMYKVMKKFSEIITEFTKFIIDVVIIRNKKEGIDEIYEDLHLWGNTKKFEKTIWNSSRDINKEQVGKLN